MKKFYPLIAFAFLMLAFSCKDDDGNEIEIESPAKVEIEAISNVLETVPAMTAFTDALKQLDVANVDATEFTIFGVNDASLLADSKKASATISQSELKRHIASGKFDLEKLKKLNKLKMLSGDSLSITVVGNTVAINGVTIDSMKVAGKNIIFFIHKLVPIKPISETVVFDVLRCNEQWSPTNSTESFKVEAATIKIFSDNNSSLIATLTTDTAGKAAFNILPGIDYSYTVEKGDLKTLYKDFMFAGIITSQAQADAIEAIYPAGWNKSPGGLVLRDLDANGIINNQDKSSSPFLSISQSTEKVLLISDKFVWPTPPAKADTISQENMKKCERLYYDAFYYFSIIDYDYSTLAKRQTITTSDKSLDSLWTNSYIAIKTINKYLEIVGPVDQTQQKYRGDLRVWRSMLNMHLGFIFGGVPIDTTPNANLNTLTRNTLEEVYTFVMDDLTSAIKYLPAVKKMDAVNNSALIYLMQKNYSKALDNADYIINSGLISYQHNYQLFVKTWLYKIEALNKMGRNAEALHALNMLATQIGVANFGTSATKDEIKSHVKDLFFKYTNQKGIVYANITRWGDNASWGKYMLMPIPAKALQNSNGALTQNPGW